MLISICKHKPSQYPRLMEAKKKLSLLTFLISGSNYSIKTTKVAEVIQQPNLVFLPTPIQNYAGVIYYNGDFIPILDMHKHLISGPAIPSHTNSIIIIHTLNDYDKNMVAVLVDEVKDIISIEEDKIFNIQYSQINSNKQLLKGVYKHKNRLIHLIDIEALYSTHNSLLKRKNTLVHEM